MFKTICLTHLDNRTAQIKAADTGPWKLASTGTDKDGEARFRSELVGLSVSADPTKGCALTAAIDPKFDIEKVQTEVASGLSFPKGKAMPSPDSRYWMIGIPRREDRYVITLKVKNYGDDNLVTLNSSKL